MDRADENNVCT